MKATQYAPMQPVTAPILEDSVKEFNIPPDVCSICYHHVENFFNTEDKICISCIVDCSGVK